MTDTRSWPVVRGLLLTLLAGAALLLTGTTASAQGTEVHLTGDDANNFFIVRAISATEIEFCTDRLGCFRRPAADVQRVAIDGFGGDDGVFISHRGALLTHPTVPLNLTFDGGLGSDELRICSIEACAPTVTTDVSILPESDELRIVQCEGAKPAGGRCVDEPFQQPVRTLKVNVRGADVVTDLSRGPMTMIGTPSADDVTLDGGESFGNTAVSGNAVQPTARISVANVATVQVLNKSNITIDPAGGADRVLLGALRNGAELPTFRGLADTTTSCAVDGSAGAPLCVVAGPEAGDAVEILPGAGAEAVSLTTRPTQPSDTSRLAGTTNLPTVDLTAVDALVVPTQPGEGDSFTLYGSPIADALAWDAGTTDLLRISGTLATGTSIPAPIPTTELRSDGTGPIRATIDPIGGEDLVTMTSGAVADDVGVARGTAGLAVAHTAGSTPHSTVTTTSERVDLLTGDGADVLRTTGELGADVRWDGGPGEDLASHTGDGTPVGADLGQGRIGSLAQVAAALATPDLLGLTTAAVERWALTAPPGSPTGPTPKVTVYGSTTRDAMTYTPTASDGGTLAVDGGPAIAVLQAGLVELLPQGGDDTLTVVGTTGADSIAVGRGASTTARVAELMVARADDSLESLVLDGRSGDDRFLISGSGGTATITAVGGVHTGGDRLSFADSAESATLTFDAVPSAGTMAADGPPIAFRDLEHVDVEGNDVGAFTVIGSDTHDVLVQDGQTVTAGRGTTAQFTRYPVLRLDGRVGDDDVVVAPRTLSGVTDIQVVGGDAGTDRAVVIGSDLRETLVYTPTGSAAGEVAMSFAPLVSATGVEEVEIDGRTAPPSGDTLQVRSPAIDGTAVVTPGSTTDAGTVALVDGSGAATSAPPLHFAGIGRGPVVVDGADAAGAAADLIRIVGQPDADVVTLIGDGTGRTTTTVDTRVDVVATAVRGVQLHGLDGQDTFNLPLAHGIPGGSDPAIAVDAGGPSGGDVAAISAAGAPVVVDLSAGQLSQVGSRPIAVAGLDRIDLAADGQPATLLGGPGPDRTTVRPTAPDAAQITSDLLAARLDLTGAPSLTVDTREGGDGMTVLGSAAAEAIAVTRGILPQVRVADLLAVTATDAVEAIRVDALEGADATTVDGAGGPASLVLDGGVPAADGDVVRLLAPDATVTFDDPPTGGQLDSPGGALTFAGIQRLDVAGDGSGVLTVRGTDGPDTVTLGDPGTPAVRVNGGAAVTYAGYPTLRLDGRGGTDTTTVSYADLGDLQAIDTAGGSALDDVVRVVDTLGSARGWTLAPLDADHGVLTASGVPTITASGTGRIELVGRGAGDVVTVRTPDGAHDVAVRPGSTPDAGTIVVGSLIPLTVTDLGADGRLVVDDSSASPADHVVLEATSAADTAQVIGADRLVRLAGSLPLIARGADRLTLRMGDGGDTVTATGPLPWATTTVEGGGPDAGDAVQLDGPAGDAHVDLAQATITGYGGTVRIPEVDDLRTSHAALGLTVAGTDSDDAMCYDPLTPRDGRMQIIASPNGGLLTDSCQPAPGTLDVLHHFVDVGRLLVDPGLGSDQVLVNGTVEDDAVIVESTGPEVAVSVNPVPADTTTVRLPVHVVTPTTENLVVATDNGVDDVDVRLHEALAPVLTLHGEAPDTRKSDHLTVRDLTGGANVNNTGSAIKGSGTVSVEWTRFSGIAVTVNYTGMEEVRTYKGQRAR